MLVHLMLELYGCDRQLLSNEPLIRRVLDEYPGRVAMERVSPVHLYEIETSNPLDAGLSGFVVMAQSHISLLIYSWFLLPLLRIQRMNRALATFVLDH
jgi:S-adenosylmethionine decarboxylase